MRSMPHWVPCAQLAYVITRGNLRHHATVLGMDVHLAEQGMRQQARFAVVQRHAGFVTGCFDAKYNHG